MYGSATSFTSSADRTRVSAPWRSSASCTASELRTRRQHAHVVAGRAVHPLGRGGDAAVDVAAADHERDLEAGRADVDELPRERVDGARVEPELPGAHQRLAGELEHDAGERRSGGRRLRRRGHQATENQA